MGVNQEAFADRCGFARTYMSRIETGGANPSINAIKVLADALGLASQLCSKGCDRIPYQQEDSFIYEVSSQRPV